jgi:hypothetical protein
LTFNFLHYGKTRKLQNRFWLFSIIFDYFWLFFIIVDYFWLFLIIFDYFLIIYCHFFNYFPRNENVSKKFRKCMKFHHFQQIFIKFYFWLILIIFGRVRILIKIRLKLNFDRFTMEKMSNFIFNRILMSIRTRPLIIFDYFWLFLIIFDYCWLSFDPIKELPSLALWNHFVESIWFLQEMIFINIPGGSMEFNYNFF